MLTALCASLLASTYKPTDSVWVYANASTQTEDPFLRIWGSGGKVISSVSDASPASWSLVQFDLSTVKSVTGVKSAHLILWHIAKCAFTIDDSLANPLEVRPCKAGFDAKKWAAEDADNFLPAVGDKDLYGSTTVDPVKADEKGVKVDVDLTKGGADLVANLKKSVESGGKFAVALTSKMEIQGSGSSHFYKVYSKNAPAEKQPELDIEWADGSQTVLGR